MEMPELIAEWIKYSKTDLDVAKQLHENMHPRPLEIICYQSQQSAEKILKTFLIQNDIQPPKTHDLYRLCKICEGLDASFNDIAVLFGSLNKYGVQPRYPFEIEILEKDAEAAIQNAEKIFEWVTQN